MVQQDHYENEWWFHDSLYWNRVSADDTRVTRQNAHLKLCFNGAAELVVEAAKFASSGEGSTVVALLGIAPSSGNFLIAVIGSANPGTGSVKATWVQRPIARAVQLGRVWRTTKAIIAHKYRRKCFFFADSSGERVANPGTAYVWIA